MLPYDLIRKELLEDANEFDKAIQKKVKNVLYILDDLVRYYVFDYSLRADL